jgi:hypothetical protein
MGNSQARVLYEKQKQKSLMAELDITFLACLCKVDFTAGTEHCIL